MEGGTEAGRFSGDEAFGRREGDVRFFGALLLGGRGGTQAFLASRRLVTNARLRCYKNLDIVVSLVDERGGKAEDLPQGREE